SRKFFRRWRPLPTRRKMPPTYWSPSSSNSPDTLMSLLVVVIALALIFDFINGFHDAANSIATVVSTKVLSPLTAVLWAAAFNFLAFWIFELKVADTVSKTVRTDA